MSSTMQKNILSISLLVCVQVNDCKEANLCWEPLGGLHHGPETYVSLFKAISASDLILFCQLKSVTQQPSFPPALSKFTLHWITLIGVQTCVYFRSHTE